MTRTIKMVFPGGKKVDVVDRDMTIHTDQSVENGGEGSAPEPFSLFLASLAACVGVYALDFCQARSIPTERLAVVMHAERNPEKKMYTRISIEVTPPPEFPEKYREAILRAVNLCSVKKHVMDPPEFDVTLV